MIYAAKSNLPAERRMCQTSECPECEKNDDDDETIASSGDREPKGHMSKCKALGGVESDSDRLGYDGIRGGMDSATRGTRCESKRLGTGPLAEDDLESTRTAKTQKDRRT